jgi:hypothetical protein
VNRAQKEKLDMNLTLNDVLTQVKEVTQSGLTKTASEEKPADAVKTSEAQKELLSAINDALEPEEKTASETPAENDASAVNGLVKMASNLASAEEAALVKEAHLYGGAVADGFMARLSQYDQAVDPSQAKVASTDAAPAETVPTEEEFVKFAEANPDLVKQAMEQGYNDTKAELEQVKTASLNAELEKLAETPEGREKLAEIKRGYDDTVAQIEKLASTEEGQAKLAGFQKGYEEAMAEIEQLSGTKEGQEKLAAIQEEEMVKIANNCFERGYADTITMLEQVK